MDELVVTEVVRAHFLATWQPGELSELSFALGIFRQITFLGLNTIYSRNIKSTPRMINRGFSGPLRRLDS